MFTSIIFLAGFIGVLNIMFIIYSTFASKRRLRKDQYALAPVRIRPVKEATPLVEEPFVTEANLDGYVVDGIIMYSKEDLLSQRFSRIDSGNEVSPKTTSPSPARFTLADFK